MDFVVHSREDLIASIYAAQRHAGSFRGDALLAAAEAAGRLAIDNGWLLIAADSSGERIVGTATTVVECALVDTSRRLDDVDVLVVAGMIAGPYGVLETAARSRSMGARAVHCFYVGGWSGDLDGVDTVHRFADASIQATSNCVERQEA